jgi:hypothetical protein
MAVGDGTFRKMYGLGRHQEGEEERMSDWSAKIDLGDPKLAELMREKLEEVLHAEKLAVAKLGGPVVVDHTRRSSLDGKEVLVISWRRAP